MMTASMTHRPRQRNVAPVIPMLLQQVKVEFLKLVRTPGFSISSLAVPVVLFGLFGLRDTNVTRDGVNAGLYALASFGTYGVMSVMLYSFGAGIAVERGQRALLLARATPLRPAVAIVARAVTALAFALLMLLILFAFGVGVGGIRVDPWTLLDLAGRLLLGSIPFIALGFALGFLVSPTAAAPIINICFLMLSFASGLFVPITALPDFVQTIAPFLPTYRLAQLAWNAVGVPTDPIDKDIRWLAIYGMAFVIIAVRAYHRGEERTSA
jgi:ABC-2 type transport system permease protein